MDAQVIRLMFQFLIGTLKTYAQRSRQDMARRFQFLIGTLKTHQVDFVYPLV